MVTNPKSTARPQTREEAQVIPFDRIHEPGTYFANWSGNLIRVPEDGVKPGRSPVIEILGREPMTVTKLSDDPYLTITKARMIAADLDLECDF